MPHPPGPPDPPLPKLEGSDLLQGLSREMVRCMKDYFGKGALKAKAYLMDDLCFVVMRDVLTPAEDTMLEAGDEQAVREFRLAYQTQMTERLVGTVEQLTGRAVLTYHSQIMFNPSVLIEMFLFDDDSG